MKEEREKDKKQKLSEKSGKDKNEKEKKSSLDSLKVQRAGVGKYLTLGTRLLSYLTFF